MYYGIQEVFTEHVQEVFTEHVQEVFTEWDPGGVH